MEKRNYLPIAGLIILILGSLCGICAGISIAAAAFRSSGGLAALAPVLATTTSIQANVTRTATLTPEDLQSTVMTITAASKFSETLTAFPEPGITNTVGLTTTTSITTTATALPTAPYDIGSSDSWCLPWNTQSTEAQVIRVMDGITIEVSIAGQIEQVRYLGIAMLPAPAFSAERAAIIDKNKALVEGKTVLLIKDLSDRDDQGRLLRYVIAAGIFVNREMVESGFALAASSPPDTRCDSIFTDAEYLARAFQHGLWEPTPTPMVTRYIPSATPTPHTSGEVEIIIIYNKGNPWEEANEFVEIKNNAGVPIQLAGWTLRNSAGHTFIFPSFIITPGLYCRIYTNEYHPGSCGFSFYRLSQVWDNVEDCAYLKDANGELIDVFCYD